MFVYGIEINIYISNILEIDPCGGKETFVIPPDSNGFIDSSALEINNDTHLSCKWRLKVQKRVIMNYGLKTLFYPSLAIKVHAVESDSR